MDAQEADSLVNERRNRYFNVVPFDGNRVRLLGGGQDYINASLLESGRGEEPAWQYIATQVSRNIREINLL
jgi:protein tyrosine phosphatase